MTPIDPKKLRAVRVDAGLWKLAQDTADQRGESVSEVIRRGLIAYTRRHRGKA